MGGASMKCPVSSSVATNEGILLDGACSCAQYPYMSTEDKILVKPLTLWWHRYALSDLLMKGQGRFKWWIMSWETKEKCYIERLTENMGM